MFLTTTDKLERPLMLIHGLAALLAAGRTHVVLPLSGVTHMTSQEIVAENLAHLQVDFLRRNLS